MIKIYGKNCINECIRAKGKIEKIFILDQQAKKDNKFISLLNDRRIPYEIVAKGKMDSLFGANHQGYGAYRADYKLYDENILDELSGSSMRVVILDGIVDPHNLGAILRSVDAFGYDAVILPKNRSANITEIVAHVSTGAIEHVKIAYVNSLNTIVTRLKDKGYWICGTDAKGTTLVSEIDPSLNLVIIIGSEGFGMSKTLVNACDYLITIPMKGHVNSLNASVSAGIVLSQLIKQ
jgi:23S rRNA (guanosine2251-2'-O)-methyltransferase